MVSEDFFFAYLTKSLATKLYWWADNLLWPFFSCLSFHGFSADSSWEKSSFYAHSICTVCNVTRVPCPFAPYIISTVDSSILCAFEEFTCWRTMLHLSQYMHNLLIVLLRKLSYCNVTSLIVVSRRLI